MLKLKFIKKIITVFLTVLFFHQSAKAEIITGTDCGGSCTWTYDSDTETLSYEGQGRISTPVSSYNLGDITNVIIGEGISEIKPANSSQIVFDGVGKNGGSFIMPKSLTLLGKGATNATHFSTVEIKSPNVTMESNSMLWDYSNNREIDLEFIIMGSQNISMDTYALHGCHTNSKSFTLSCKGDSSICNSVSQNMRNHMWNGGGTFTAYTKYDENQNLIEAWDATGGKLYDSQGNILAIYDTNGNTLNSYSYSPDGSVYTYDANHNLVGAKKTSPFTPAEAAALVKKGNVNKVTLTFK